jgi:hypothetical protein
MAATIVSSTLLSLWGLDVAHLPLEETVTLSMTDQQVHALYN